MLFGVPTMYHRLADAAEADRGGRERAGPRAAARVGLRRAAGKDLQPRPDASGQRIVERYGLTETIMNTAVRADGERRPGEVGRSARRRRAAVRRRRRLRRCRADGETIGEVVVRGPNLFLGYLNRPEATAEVVRDGWFWTGDLATRAPDGYLRIVGRKSTDLIKTGGYKVGAGEVEGALLEHPAVSEAAVRVSPTRIWASGSSPGSCWQLTRPHRRQRRARDHVAALLAPHKRPREVHFVDELPRNAMGKVVKQRLVRPSEPAGD